MEKRKNTFLFIMIIAIAGFGIVSIFTDLIGTTADTSSKAYVYEKNLSELNISIEQPYLETDADTGKVIVHIPIELTNESDHAFTFSIPHFYYNETESVFTLFDLQSGNLKGKITRSDSKNGEVVVKLKTRDKSEVKTINPIISIYDMKSEETTELKPVIKLQ
ncbi:hypothetical protein [Heyndrickxia oleronia]|uniref:DUF4352 domain-containing protein n=1 Tax=Heyndrickxia oleronia TaxID=38875 RepID=A0AAW6SSK1_9BACI|nr:hypothetical protein [Heyndrickxia oleronia]MDH5159802.1 hypothetical protein [Heyndrickxia oleronia]